MNDWEPKQLWRKRSETFCIEIVHWESSIESEREGPHRWNIYAYIYPSHPIFKDFDGKTIFQPAAMNLPLHGGPSFLRYHRDDEGKISSIQVGCDYHHIDDEEYTQMDQNHAEEIFRDANDLFKWLKKRE